ncbi:MAG: hypothetical protein ABI222_09870 [Opitutaceae bacterium]
MEPISQATSDLTVEWARLLAPHFGPSGSMDLDLRDWPKAEGPSFYNQFSHFVFLQLATGEVPGATAPEREAYLRIALNNIEYALAITDADFHTPHYSRGKDWGRHIGEWLVYYLLCSLELIERHQLGSADLRTRLAKVVTGATATLHGRFVKKYAATPAEFIGNHDTWHGLLFYRAGRHFRREEWMNYARDLFARCVLPFQTPDGYWPEGHGIVVGYALVTAQAVSLYAELSGDEAALTAIGRFFGFYEFFSFPDGTTSVVVDVRMRYSLMPFMFLPPGFLRCEAGRRAVLARLQAAQSYFAAEGVHDNGAQSFTFFGSFAEFVFAPVAKRAELQVVRPMTLPAARVAQGDWQAYLGWQVTPEHPSRFVLDSQSFVEVWHRQAGYVAGTGGGKFMPRFSTIRRIDEGRAYIPERVSAATGDGERASVQFGFGPDDVELGVRVEADVCSLSARLIRPAAKARYEAALIFPFRHGETVTIDDESQKIEPGISIHRNWVGRPVKELKWRGLTWRMPEGAQLEYPIVPHNSYTQDGLPTPGDYVGRLTFPVSVTAQIVTIR